MTDIEVIKNCAEAMDMRILGEHSYGLMCHNPGGARFYYDPLRDDAQAMALVKKLHLDIEAPRAATEDQWEVYHFVDGEPSTVATDKDLNRAICECVAKMSKP